ncbi:MAG: AAC(3) family N-acetyltransferase [Pirellulales bacterium]|nr:AAC(3) family N-acetyltransferase [Pirellulales bacterium]
MTPQSPFSRFADGVLLAGEVLARQVYWRMPWLRNALASSRRWPKEPIRAVRRGELRDFLREIGVVEGALTMAHTAVTNLRFEEAGKESAQGGFLAAAKTLVDLLLDLLGPAGTLVMPTNPQYEADDLNRSFAERGALVLPYDPLRTPCAVGMANELFWRRKGALRSLHPYNPLAAAGPLAEELLRDNLNPREPLPHGVDSGYYRFCARNGLVVSVGVPLWRSITIIHVAEEIRDADWPIKNFFERRRYAIRIGGRDEIQVVRQRRPAFGSICVCNRKVRRDLLREGILHEGKIGAATVDWASAREVFDYLMERNRNSHYPYYGVNLLRSEQ